VLGGLADTLTKARKPFETEASKVAAGAPGEAQAIIKAGETEAAAAEQAGATEAAGIETAAERERRAAEAAVRRQAGKITAAGEKGKAGIPKAETEAKGLRRQAAQLSAKGQEIYDRIVGRKFDERQVQSLIRSGDRQLWSELAPIINENPQARDALVDYIRRYIGDAATSSPRGIANEFRQNIKPALESFDLADSSTISRLEDQIAELGKIVEPAKRATMAQKLLINAVRTEVGRPLSSIFGLLPSPFAGNDDVP